MRNPFKPSFGATPPLLVGRDDLLTDFSDALADGPGAGGRAMLYTGARGAGKTVMLNAIEAEARAEGWLVISETATRGLVERLTQSRLPELLRRLDPDAVRRCLTGLKIPLTGGGGLDWETVESHVARVDLRSQIDLLTDLLAENETGLLITLDEIHRNEIEELRELAAVVQHAFREERELDEVRRALKEPIEAGGRRVGAGALDVMSEGTQGYPFLIQLVGSHCWRVRRNANSITLADAEAGVASARRRLGSLVHAPALAAASDVDKSFLLAMARDDGRSRMADIATRLDVSKEYAGMYRRRLIDAELIQADGRGYVDFTLPYLRDYLREHAAADV